MAQTKEYWRGYRAAQSDVIMCGIDSLRNVNRVAESSEYLNGYSAGVRAQARKLSKLLKNASVLECETDE